MKSHDKNILSGYIGRSLTLIIALLILAVTMSALITGGGITHRATIRICRLESAAVPSAARAAALGELLSAISGQPVTITTVAGIAGADCELLILPTFEWLAVSDQIDGLPIFSLAMIAGRNDEALLITGRDGEGGTMSDLSITELQFTNHRSINGFWNQLEMLREGGMHLPADLDRFLFTGGDEHAYERVIVAVLSGRARYGACRGNALRELEHAGILPPGELAIVTRRPALPEVLIISSRDKATYYRTHLERVSAALATEYPRTPSGVLPVAIEALTPEVLDRMQAIERLIGEYRGQF